MYQQENQLHVDHAKIVIEEVVSYYLQYSVEL